MGDERQACPECGAVVDLLCGRWLGVHTDPRLKRRRLALGGAHCAGSLLELGTWGGLGPVDTGGRERRPGVR